MKQNILILIFILACVVTTGAQVTSQRVVFTSSNPPTACVSGKVYTNQALNPGKAWVGTSTGACTEIDASAAAPANATYITQTPNASLSAEQALSVLATGIVKNTTTTGVLSIAVSNTDYQAPITFGTGVLTALGVNVGTAGSPVVNGGALGTPSSGTATNLSGTAASLTAGAVTGFTAGAGVLTGPASAGVAQTLGNTETVTGAKTFNNSAGTTFSSSPIVLSGNISGSGIFGTGGIRIKGVTATFNDTTSSGTVAAAYTDTLGGNTLTATGATTITDYNTINIQPATASTNVTVTRKHSLGILDSTSASSSITGGLIVATTYGTTATSVGIGGGNINAGGTIIAGGSLTGTSLIAPNINPAADFTLTNNAVAAVTSVNSGALVNTLYLKAGDVGIGTTAPDLVGFGGNTLTIQSSSANSFIELSNSSTSTSGVAGGVAFLNGSARLGQFSVAANGATNKGVMTLYTANAGSLQAQLTISDLGGLTLGGSAYTTGGCSALAVTVTTGVVTCTASSASIKQDRKLFTGALEQIRLIKPETFAYRKGTAYFEDFRPRLGLIADNLKEANPLLVRAFKQDGLDLLQPDQMALHGLEIESINELITIVNKQHHEIEKLRDAVKRLSPKQ